MLQTVSRLLPELSLFLMTAVATHLVMSFAQTLMHYKLGHHSMGGKFFRNHINFHHTYYSKDHLVSRKYLGDEGNNTPFFFVPVFLVGACTYFVLPVDLFVVQVVACAVSFYAHVFFDKEYHVEGSRLRRFAWFTRKQELHFVHHRHANSNFAVIHFFWDRILGTYRRPDAGQTQTNGTLRIGGPDGCSAIRNGRRCLSSPITLRHGSSHPRAYRLRDHDRCHLSDTVRTNHQTASPRPLQSVRRCDCE
jgi:sterol desaturase/sphingolipid hydroxylase (fatty acid hydroxylase superfamily)